MLFVGTKRQAQDAIAEEAQRCGMFFVNQRWLGGLLTNFSTIQRSLGRLRELEAMATDGRYETLSKKEIARIEKEKKKLQKNLDGIRLMAQAARRGLRRRHPQGEDRGRRGAEAEDPGHRRGRHQLRPGRGGLRHPGQRRRAARDPAVRLAARRRRRRRPRPARSGAGRDADADDRTRPTRQRGARRPPAAARARAPAPAQAYGADRRGTHRVGVGLDARPCTFFCTGDDVMDNHGRHRSRTCATRPAPG